MAFRERQIHTVEAVADKNIIRRNNFEKLREEHSDVAQ